MIPEIPVTLPLNKSITVTESPMSKPPIKALIHSIGIKTPFLNLD
jgi:hypothetical protein